MKRIIAMTTAAVLALLGTARLEAEPPSIMEAIREAAVKLREKIIREEPRGAVIIFKGISNEMDEPEQFAHDKEKMITPILRGEGELTLVNGDRVRKDLGWKIHEFHTEEEIKKAFPLGIDLVITGKVDASGNFSFEGLGEDGRRMDLGDIPFNLDDEYFKLFAGFNRPAAPTARMMPFTGEILSLAYDGITLAVSGASGALYTINSNTGEPIRTIREQGTPANDLAYGPSGELIAAEDTGSLRIITGGGERIIPLAGGPLSAVVCTPAGRIFAASRGRVDALDLDTGARFYSLEKVTGAVQDMALAGGGKTLYVLDEQGIGVYDAATGKRLRTIPGAFGCFAVDPQGRYIATAEGPVIKLYRLNGEADREIQSPPQPGSENPITSLLFSRSGMFLISADAEGLVKTWLVSRGLGIHIIERRHLAEVTKLKARPDGLQFASGGNDSQVGLWRALAEPTGRIVIKSNVSSDAHLTIGGAVPAEGSLVPARGTKTFNKVPIGGITVAVNAPSGVVLGSSYDGRSAALNIKEDSTVEITLNENYYAILDADTEGRIEPRTLSTAAGGLLIIGYRGSIPAQTGRRAAAAVLLNPSLGNYTLLGGSREEYHRRNITASASEGSICYTADEGGELKAWKNGVLAGTASHGEKVLTLSVKGKYLVSGGESYTKLWDSASMTLIRAFEGAKGILEGDSVLAVINNREIRRYSLNGGTLPVFPREAVPGEPPAGSALFAAEVLAVKQGAADSLLVILANGMVELRNARPGRPLTFPGTTAEQNRKGLIIAGQSSGTIEVRDETGKLINSIFGHTKEVTGLSFLSETAFASISHDGSVKIFDLNTGQENGSFLTYQDGQKTFIKGGGRFRGDSLKLFIRSGGTTRRLNDEDVKNLSLK